MLCVQFVNFANEATGGSLTVDDFWSDPLVKSYYKNHMSFLLNHPNKLLNNLQFKVTALGQSRRRSHVWRQGLCVQNHPSPVQTTCMCCSIPQSE